MGSLFAKEKTVEVERRVRANDTEFNQQYDYASNYISTSKYNFVTFLPKNLFEQFRRFANAYFLALLILQLFPAVASLDPVTTALPLCFVLGMSALKDAFDDVVIPWISSLTPLTTILPLFGVLTLSAAKDAFDDIQRHRSDDRVNNRKSLVLREGELVEELWHRVAVGDIIKMENDMFVAADLLLLSSSEPNSLCYVETAELDGETNLKIRQAIEECAEMADDHNLLSKFNGETVCEPPNNNLSKFEGKLMWQDKTFSLDPDKTLLRGCVIRNTEWCFGLVMYAGNDTKLMQNTGKTTFKMTRTDGLVNVLIVGIFVFLCTVCALAMICCGVWETVLGVKFQLYLPWDSYVPTDITLGGTVISLMIFLSYIIILNTFVPISLYVCIEVLRLSHSWLIDWDEKMYHAASKTNAKARTTSLNEELGQIEYIFSDKTGTLTQNIMAFMKCSINGKSYGDPHDSFGRKVDIDENTPSVNFMDNPMYDGQFKFYDDALVRDIKSGNQDCHMFFKLLSLCHTVMPEEKDGKLAYQAQSPDEGALVSAARNFGFVFKNRTPSSITIEVNGSTEVYELLAILDFNNFRKRMSVIVRREGQITLYCKGADTVIYERIKPDDRLSQYTSSHLNDYAQDGLRTLCLAYRNIDGDEFAKWKSKHHEASISLENREEMVNATYEEIEQNLLLIGASAVEDKLQDGVPETIANLAVAGIKIWVLTGDKQETAINIGYSCKLLTDDMEEIFIISGDHDASVIEEEMKAALQAIQNYTDGVPSTLSPFAVSFSGKDQKNQLQTIHANGAASQFVGGDEPSDGTFALVITGGGLIHALTPRLEDLFLKLACSCAAVICCRVTPLQKAMVVDLVKRSKRTVTLAIGDGANDVSMIKMAHIGVGISGQEGMQAVLASDYSLAQFRFLERLLLVHGRWSYLRMCKFLKYFFYKNFSFTLCHLWFAFYCGFSAQTIFDPIFIGCYNLFYTSLPVLALGLFEQDINDHYSVRYPKLYTPGHLDLFFNKGVFGWSVLEGVLTSLALFFIPYATFSDVVGADGRESVDIHSLGTAIATILVFVVNFRCAIDMQFWTVLNHLTIWISIITYFIINGFLYSDVLKFFSNYTGAGRNVWSRPHFWFALILCHVVVLLPIITWRFFCIDTSPTLQDKVRLKQRLRKSKSTDFGKRQSSRRRSQRSFNRSGYAFSHQEGFGELITSGKNFRDSVRPTKSKTPRE